MAVTFRIIFQLISLQIFFATNAHCRHIVQWQGVNDLINRQNSPLTGSGSSSGRLTTTTSSSIAEASRPPPLSQISDSVENLQDAFSELTSELSDVFSDLEERIQVLEDTIRGLVYQMPGPVSIPADASDVLTR